MPRHDWRDDELMGRERGDFGYRSGRSRHGDEDRDRGAFFGDRDEPRMRRRMGGWGSLLGDESSGGRESGMEERPGMRRERRFGPDDDRPGIPRDETERLIASNKVEGTPVFDRHGNRLGSVHNFMVDKFRGRVVYAVLKHGSGFLGLDDRYYPLDWDQLTYDERLGGYHIDMTEDQLKSFGSWDRDERWSSGRFEGRGGGSDREFGRERDRERDLRPDYARSPMREPW